MSVFALASTGFAQTDSDTMGAGNMESSMESMPGDPMDNSMNKDMDSMDAGKMDESMDKDMDSMDAEKMDESMKEDMQDNMK